MSTKTVIPSVFLPHNEPYLGLSSLKMFDQIIVRILKGNTLVAEFTHLHKESLTPLQHAACQIIPQGISIALSLRELLRQAYLFPALVLMRPLIERVAVISYLQKRPEYISKWKDGWKYKERPSLAEMLHVMSGEDNKKVAEQVVSIHNHIVHGDPIGSYFNLIHMPDGTLVYPSGKMLNNSKLCDEIAAEALSYLIILMAQMSNVFPNVTFPDLESV